MLDYKSKRVRSIIERQTGYRDNVEEYDEPVVFGDTKFHLYMYPKLKSQIELLDSLYLSYQVAASDDVEENFYTSNIEGANISTINETREICNSKIIKGKKEGMVLGFSKAVKVLKESKEQRLDVQLANKVHDAVVEYWSDTEQGLYRDNNVYVGSLTEVAFRPCDCNLIQERYPDVFTSFTGNPIINATLLHFFLVYLHPYYDGNGRTARLLLKESLVRNAYCKLVNTPISKYIHKTINTYYKSIRLAEEDLDVTHFVVYMLNTLETLLLDGQTIGDALEKVEGSILNTFN